MLLAFGTICLASSNWLSLCSIPYGFQDAKVVELINPENRCWDPHLVRGLFSPQEADLVLSIPLSRTMTEDILFWPFVSWGVYTVKSGYNFLVKENLAPSQNFSNPSPHDSFWKKIWSAEIPNKVRNFLWRACRNAIPLKTNLVRRNILSDDNCELCRSSPESVLHVLWKCSGLTNIWETNLH